jgi:hypothetical protein
MTTWLLYEWDEVADGNDPENTTRFMDQSGIEGI